MNFINPVGPKFEGDGVKAWWKVLDFTSQVWINCEHQVNMYGNSCGSLFASVGNNFRDRKAISAGSNTINQPVSIFYSLALEFGKHIDSEDFGKEAALMAIFFIKWAAFLEKMNSLSFNILIDGFCESMNHVDNLKSYWSDPMLECLQTGRKTIEKIRSRNDILIILQSAASNVEIAAAKHKGSSGSHLVGITFRAIFQALKMSI